MGNRLPRIVCTIVVKRWLSDYYVDGLQQDYLP